MFWLRLSGFACTNIPAHNSSVTCRMSGYLFVFYSEPAHQKPALVVSGTREDANPSVNDKLHSYTVTVRPRFGAPF